MTGIYIHIPYCKQKCHYCNFYSIASVRHRDKFLESLNREIGLRRDYLGVEPVDSIYLGGGTPSLFRAGELERIFYSLLENFTLSENAEITLEANPDDMDDSFMKGLRATPVNRLSIGIQSFRDEDLHYLNRVHSAGQAERSVQMALDKGYENLSIDLIFGIPTLTDDDLVRNLEVFHKFRLPHLSAYALTVEPKTALDVLIRKGKMKDVDEEKLAGQFRLLSQWMGERGYIHYEISNYCREGQHAKHNTNYWTGGKYLGLGPSAHSFDGSARQWNVADLAKYIQGMENGTPFIEQEVLTDIQKFNEYVMVTLRTMWGTDPDVIRERFNTVFLDYFKSGIKKFIDRGFVICDGGTYRLSDSGKLHADGIAAELFWPEDGA